MEFESYPACQPPLNDRLLALRLSKGDEERIKRSSDPDRALDILSYLGEIKGTDQVGIALEILESGICNGLEGFEGLEGIKEDELKGLTWLVRSWTWLDEDLNEGQNMSPELREQIAEFYVNGGDNSCLPPDDQPLTRNSLHLALYLDAFEQSEDCLDRRLGKKCQGMPVEWDLHSDGYQHQFIDQVGDIIESKNPALVLELLTKHFCARSDCYRSSITTALAVVGSLDPVARLRQEMLTIEQSQEEGAGCWPCYTLDNQRDRDEWLANQNQAMTCLMSMSRTSLYMETRYICDRQGLIKEAELRRQGLKPCMWDRIDMYWVEVRCGDKKEIYCIDPDLSESGEFSVSAQHGVISYQVLFDCFLKSYIVLYHL